MFLKKSENIQYDPQYETSVVPNSREQLAASQGSRHAIRRFFIFLALFHSGFEDRLLYKVHQPSGNSNFLFPLQQNKWNFKNCLSLIKNILLHTLSKLLYNL